MEEVRIAIVTGTSGEISLSSEIRLVKPALLYADSVTLYSPIAALLQSTASVGLNEELTLDLLRQVGPLIDPNSAAAFEALDELVAKTHKTRNDMQLVIGFRRQRAHAAKSILGTAEELFEQARRLSLLV